MHNLIFMASYPTHAAKWRIVLSPETEANPNNSDFYVRDRDGKLMWVWFDIFATDQRMLSHNVYDLEMLDEMDETYEIHEL